MAGVGLGAGWAGGRADAAGDEDGDDDAEGEAVEVAPIILNHIGFGFAGSPFPSALGQPRPEALIALQSVANLHSTTGGCHGQHNDSEPR